MNTAGKFSIRASRGRLRMFLVVAVAGALLVPVAISWACGPNRAIQTDRVTYLPGQTVFVSGANFEDGASVRIKVDGETVTTTTVSATGNISASFPAPSAAGTYVLTSDGVDQNGQALAGTGNARTFAVASPAASPGGAPGSAPGTAAPGTAAPGRQGTAAPAPGTTTSGAVGRRGRADNRRSVSGRERLRRAVGGRALANAGINTTEGVITPPGGTTSFAGSVTQATRAGVAALADGRRTARGGRGAGRAATRPSDRSAGADLWSGFASAKNPSLIPGATDRGSGGAGSGLPLAMGLLGLGALTLLGLGAAEARRRRKVPSR